MRNPLLIAAAITAFASSPSVVLADHDSRLYELADRYRDAVRHFEDDVRDADYFHRYDEKLVDRMEDAARDFRSATRDAEDVDRLLYRWEDVRSLQPRVERAILGRRCYPPNPQLMHCWDDVRFVYELLAREMHVIASRPWCAAPEVCNGQCGYHAEYRYRPGRHGHAPRPAPDSGYDRSRQPRRTGPGAWDRSESRRATIPANPPRHDTERQDTERQDTERRDLGAAVVGSLVRRLLD